MPWVLSERIIACLENERLLVLAGKNLMMLCAIHPDKIAVAIKIALNQIENLPYPFAPNKFLKTGMDKAEINEGKIMLMR